MPELPDGWTWSSRKDVEGGRLYLAERMYPHDIAQKRNVIDEYTTILVGPDGPVVGPIRFERAAAQHDYDARQAIG